MKMGFLLLLFFFNIWVLLWRFEKKGFLGLVVWCGFDVEFRACFKKASFLVRLNGARGARRGQVRAPEKKNPFSKRTGSGPRVLAHKSGLGMQKPGPNPTRCHSYYEGECSKCTKSHYERTIEMISLFVFHYLSYFNLHILILSIIDGYNKMKTV